MRAGQRLSFVEQELCNFCKKVARICGKKFKLKYKSIEVFADDDPDRINTSGMCTPDGEIFLSLRQGRLGRFETIEELIDTTIHELVHLRHFDHGKKFHKLRSQIKRWFKENHINNR
jgi:predicted metal-dependent hydrolase